MTIYIICNIIKYSSDTNNIIERELREMNISCCRTCVVETGRHPGCHSECEKYIKEKENLDKHNSEIRQQRYKNGQVKGYFREDNAPLC